VTVTTRDQDGALVFSEIISGHWISRVYLGYTMREASRLFVEFLNGIK